jgi:hypothetical protein
LYRLSAPKSTDRHRARFGPRSSGPIGGSDDKNVTQAGQDLTFALKLAKILS